MSIKPIDLQVMMPKTQEVSKIHSDEQQRNQAAQQQQAAVVQHKAEDNLRQVHSQDKSQQAKIKDKQEKNQGNNKGKKKDNKEGHAQENEANPNFRTSTIDIKI